MLYLEDYLEMIEHLPQELRDRFTDMREMDLSVQNNMDTLEKRIRILFAQCRRNEMSTTQANIEFENIRKDYFKVLEDADEKVQLANQMYDLVDRYLRRLDSELYKFKCELEADNNGITEILEKRSLELDGTSSGHHAGNHKENRYFGLIVGNNHTSNRDHRYRVKPEKRHENMNNVGVVEKRPAIGNNLGTVQPITVRPTTPTIVLPPPTPVQQSVSAYNLQHIGAGNAIVAAASQAIAATQQMQQGRRTASLKASYEAIHGSGGNVAHELLMGSELAGAAAHCVAIQAASQDNGSTTPFGGQRRQKKKLSTNSLPLPKSVSGTSTPIQGLPASVQTTVLPTTSSLASNSILLDPPTVVLNEHGLVVEQTPEGEWTYDPNEPRYCICNQVSYGDMVACDNEACPFEWFHYPCVGITQSPKGKWYCPKCTASMKRRGARK